MIVEVLQENLAKALSIASRFSSSKVQLPILSNILLKTKKNKLLVSATNLEMSISTSVGAKVDKEGELTVPSKIISDLVANLNQGPIHLKTDKEILAIESGDFKSTVSGINSSEFPDIPASGDKDAVELDSDNLIKSVSKILYAVSGDETRPVLTGALLIIKDGELNLVSTDGFRMCLKKIKISEVKKINEEIRVIIPKTALSELIRILKEESVSLTYKKSDSSVIFESGKTVLSTRIIEGSFPDYEKIIPKSSEIIVSVDRDELLQAVKLASVFARDSANVVKFIFGQDGLVVNSESKTSGKQAKVVDVKYEEGGADKDGFTVAFNFRFLEDFLSACEGDDVRIKLVKPEMPVVFLDSRDEDYLHIIMPVKLQN